MTDAAAPSSAPAGASPAANGRSPLGAPLTASAPSPAPAASAAERSSEPPPRADATAAPIRRDLRSGLPSAAALALARATPRELELALVRGAPPDLDALVGWEFRGINATPQGAPPLARLAGIQKFVKGMFRADGGRRDGQVMGYNCPVVQNVLDGRWQTRPTDAAPRRFGFFTVAPVDPTRRDNRYLHALLLDYGEGGNPTWDITRGLRDYLVQLTPGDPDLLLGKAYAAVGPARIPLGYFLLERWRRAPGRHGPEATKRSA